MANKRKAFIGEEGLALYTTIDSKEELLFSDPLIFSHLKPEAPIKKIIQEAKKVYADEINETLSITSMTYQQYMIFSTDILIYQKKSQIVDCLKIVSFHGYEVDKMFQGNVGKLSIKFICKSAQ